MELQEQMESKLKSLGLPSRSVKVYGSQIVVTCTSAASAQKWAPVLGKFATVRRVAASGFVETLDGASNAPKWIRVWRTWATI